uniref:Ethylene-responsive transcription factor ERF118-like n=1 Tax=Tanacetum cinerariifolium TaxID=118510 RepID=A0A6L2LTK8_TANCI|nr:ethylene-responsive transcription factor ERF118-like [Tanacetum cinerariifolium]
MLYLFKSVRIKSRSTYLQERSETRLLGQSGIDLLPEVETDRNRNALSEIPNLPEDFLNLRRRRPYLAPKVMETLRVIQPIKRRQSTSVQSSLVSRNFENNEIKIESCSTSNNAIDEELLPDIGFMNPIGDEITLGEIEKDLDFGSELGPLFLDSSGHFDRFGNADDFNISGFDGKMSSELSDWDHGELNNEELAWINNTLNVDEPLTSEQPQQQ